MNTILVWLLISTSASGNNYGNAVILERFKNYTQCEHVRTHIPMSGHLSAVCVQARVLSR